MRHTLKRVRGQVLPIAAGLALLASVAILMVFNSHRAVDEKMNLVNAADAAAYSGAQMAARELNFMALTNRAMIANEVAIGHMMAYQTELDVIIDSLKNGVGGLIGVVISAVLDMFGADALLDNVNSINRVFSGTYILAVNASNALYQDYQEDDYRALAGIERDSLLGAVMGTVSQQYAISPDVNIEINSPEALAFLRSRDDQMLSEIADAAETNPFCSMIAFAEPSQPTGQTIYGGGSENRFNALPGQCEMYYQSGKLPNSPGSLDNPVGDGGLLLELLNRSAEAASSADWVVRRNADYRIVGVPVERRGTSAAVWDNNNQQINWQTDGPDTIRTRGLLNLLLSFSGEAEGDAKVLADEASSQVGGAVTALLRIAGLCGGIDCDALADSTYTGVQRYAVLNPLMTEQTPMLTAIAYQDRQCNDDLGRTESGARNPDFYTDMRMFGQRDTCFPEKSVVAYAQAKVFYQRPPCSGDNCSTGYDTSNVITERPNLFNPFWQARLATSY